MSEWIEKTKEYLTKISSDYNPSEQLSMVKVLNRAINRADQDIQRKRKREDQETIQILTEFQFKPDTLPSPPKKPPPAMAPWNLNTDKSMDDSSSSSSSSNEEDEEVDRTKPWKRFAMSRNSWYALINWNYNGSSVVKLIQLWTKMRPDGATFSIYIDGPNVMEILRVGKIGITLLMQFPTTTQSSAIRSVTFPWKHPILFNGESSPYVTPFYKVYCQYYGVNHADWPLQFQRNLVKLLEGSLDVFQWMAWKPSINELIRRLSK